MSIALRTAILIMTSLAPLSAKIARVDSRVDSVVSAVDLLLRPADAIDGDVEAVVVLRREAEDGETASLVQRHLVLERVAE